MQDIMEKPQLENSQWSISVLKFFLNPYMFKIVPCPEKIGNGENYINSSIL